MPEAPTTIDAYIARYSPEVQRRLESMRATIRQAAPTEQEKISYGLPTFVLKSNLVHFGAFKNHLGFYPTSSAIREFRKELAPYEGSKGTVRFPFAEPIPHRLIAKIVKFRVAEDQSK